MTIATLRPLASLLLIPVGALFMAQEGCPEPPAELYSFNSGLWAFHNTANNEDHPVLSADGTTAELIPDNRGGAGAAAVYAVPVSVPFTVEFEYEIWDNDGGSTWASADGLTFMFMKDGSEYGTPPTGGSRGFIAGSGYAVHFELYGERAISLRDGSRSIMKRVGAPTYTHGEWVPVRVDVTADSVDVSFDGAQVLSYSGALDTSFGQIGFSAATGAADGEHAVRNLQVY